MTLTELAKLAHVSTSTASKAFSMSDEVNENTREMIFAVAKKHGCFKKFYRSESPRCVIAVICPEFESAYYSGMLSYMKKALAEAGAEMCVSEAGFASGSVDEMVEYYDKFNTVDGIIVIGGYSASNFTHHIPMAVIGNREGDSCIRIVNEISEAVSNAVSYFVSSGVSRIGYVGDSYSSGRLNLLKKACAEYNISVCDADTVITDERFECGGYSGMCTLFERNEPPRVIFCSYDRMAIGAMRAIKERGLRIPEDIAVFGVDNDPQSEYLTPSLSSISPLTEELCRAASRELTNMIRGSAYEKYVRINGKFIPRESSKM